MPEQREVQYGTHIIPFSVRRRDRKTLEIAVEPDASVVVIAPLKTPAEAIDARVRKRAAWILRQQRYFTQFLPRTPARRFLPGETHRYLGRQYRLKFVSGDKEVVKLLRGFIVVQTPTPPAIETVKELVEGWYRTRAHLKFTERLEANLSRFPRPEQHRPNGLIIRHMRQRWGSMSPNSRLLLNLRLIEAPPDAIDYVITHELCHVAEPNHGKAFFDLLTRVLPDWPHRKDRLERAMA